ncbi:PheS-related mystery ligase SrmL [Rhodococcoides yunnanense]|uniref:FDX-ACB domain-containing protein n=1 Tax=Rhodococcoides yunnanense TaxID=278209 RepID=A0ABU4B930_9NOCA|nr:hypothetical protein [Rhodococcus yunnanensis]MDV6260699.1 hypothetical protein [Rhodococcus yunnanensis]
MNSYISNSQLIQDLSLRDLTDPDQGAHAIQLLLTDVVENLTHMWNTDTEVLRLGAVVPVEDNYDKLGFDADAVTRDRRYSRYLGPNVMLRSHTSASIPWILEQIDDASDVDRLVVLPGLVYRRDAIDRTHVGAPHQVDLWRLVSRPDLTDRDLSAMIESVVRSVLPDADWRAVSADHPYTRGGYQIDVRIGDTWMELAECGLISSELLQRSDLDPDRWSGLALGMGLDRALMLRKGLDDIRMLRAEDPRIRSQMLHLERWQPVSYMPSIRRDISVVVHESIDGELLGDAIRTALDGDGELLESVELLSVTTYDDLPDAARVRLGLGSNQVNALISMTLRPIGCRLTDREANLLRNKVYRAVHIGPVSELIDGRVLRDSRSADDERQNP